MPLGICGPAAQRRPPDLKWSGGKAVPRPTGKKEWKEAVAVDLSGPDLEVHAWEMQAV
jgi:hypothetical protein